MYTTTTLSIVCCRLQVLHIPATPICETCTPVIVQRAAQTRTSHHRWVKLARLGVGREEHRFDHLRPFGLLQFLVLPGRSHVLPPMRTLILRPVFRVNGSANTAPFAPDTLNLGSETNATFVESTTWLLGIETSGVGIRTETLFHPSHHVGYRGNRGEADVGCFEMVPELI